jgi:hypothetical protein
VTSNRKKFSEKVKKGQKKIMPAGSPLGHQVEKHL